MVFRISSIENLLCRSVSGDLNQRTGAAIELRRLLGDEALFSLAKRNDIASILAHALSQSGNGDLLTCWTETLSETESRISGYLSELDRIADAFSKEGIGLVALKNGGIARGIYPFVSCCPMGDLDVLVERKHFSRAHELLVSTGYHFQFRSPLEAADLDVAEESGGTEYWKILPNGSKLWFELQWRPVAGRWIRPDQEPAASDLIARSVSIPNTSVRLLSPEDNLLQVCLHTAKHSYVRAPGFRLHLDAERIVGAYPGFDWDLFVERVLKLEVKTAVYLSLLIPRELFGTRIPQQVLKQLAPSQWREKLMTKWLNRVGLFNPLEKKFGDAGYILFTSLLYDDVSGFLRGVLPDRAFMHNRYGFQNAALLPYYYVRRLVDLVVRRGLS